MKDVLRSSYSYLRGNLSIDSEVAAKLFGWSPQLLGDPPYREILSLNERGKHFDAFERWYQFAESSYTADRLKVFCECLAEIGSPTRPKLIDVGRRVLEVLGGEPMSGWCLLYVLGCLIDTLTRLESMVAYVAGFVQLSVCVWG